MSLSPSEVSALKRNFYYMGAALLSRSCPRRRRSHFCCLFVCLFLIFNFSSFIDADGIVTMTTGHYCMVLESLGRSLYDYIKKNDYAPFPHAMALDFTRQMLEAVEFLHSMNLVHTGLRSSWV